MSLLLIFLLLLYFSIIPNISSFKYRPYFSWFFEDLPKNKFTFLATFSVALLGTLYSYYTLLQSNEFSLQGLFITIISFVLLFVWLPSKGSNKIISYSGTFLFLFFSLQFQVVPILFFGSLLCSLILACNLAYNQMWVDFSKLLNCLFGKIPEYKYSFEIALTLSIVSTYFFIVEDIFVFEYISFILFAFLAHSNSKELFDTFWNSTITLFSFYVMYSLLTKAIDFVFVESDWTVVFKNRRLILLGPYFINPLTGDQVWRYWPAFYVFLTIICLGYGTLTEKKQRFIYPYLIFGLSLFLFLVYEEDYYSEKNEAMISNRGYDPTEAAVFLIGALIVGLLSYLGSHSYCSKLEEYQVNYIQQMLIYSSFIAFLGTLLLLDPPGETGIKPSYWGGFVLNLIFAFGSLVIGFGIGIALAFGRQSSLPVFYLPSIAIIELFRSGPLVAWLFFAQFLVPDLFNPIWEADVASRIIFVFALFFGCYLAEILRGGLQTVPYGQYEAATALGLSSTQIKLQIQLPQAIRTTLPAIVSQMIAMLKDTSLVYFFGIYDAFKPTRDIPTGQRDFLGEFEEPLVFVAFLFWIVAFYLSRVVMRIEMSLGLNDESGAEKT